MAAGLRPPANPVVVSSTRTRGSDVAALSAYRADRARRMGIPPSPGVRERRIGGSGDRRT